MDKKEKIKNIILVLRKEYPGLKTALKFEAPIQILVATMLSAQCTDERVNKVTGILFRKYKVPADFAQADLSVFEKDIHSTGFYRSKAKNIINSSKIIVEKFYGRVPDTMEELLTLPGVARKTANCVLQNAFKKVEGVVVDTHVRRLSQRLGLTKNADPVKIETDLMEAVPKRDWANISYLLIDHGRAVCHARGPDHAACVIRALCPSRGI